ncbi:A24 family peptidase C-terminal domain-containing protein [Pyrococcus yayanosii]|uniref:Peptidase A24A-predicted C-terminal archaea domain-containing protein n=1 Tax=Pyrococcus yayanosii (strain CH1 / JCM 16557) TaxID=529709 RepID=F8AIB4_PYRYC|nr:A24 family peptidase C-terminal domain-containing protein [Pyrococcus yayanosii]AEH25517.1 hypothetical protein PYCH_18620 [Pyrococcus yayanosii CH1]
MEMVPLLLGVIVGLFTSYTDLRSGFIYEEQFFPTFSLLSKIWCRRRGCEYEVKGPYIPIVELAILYYAYESIKTGNSIHALSGLIGLLVGLGLGALLYYTGGWASGDVLILGAYSAILPYAPPSAQYAAPYATLYPLNALSIFFDGLIAIFPFILIYALGVLIIRGKFGRLLAVFREGARFTVEIALWINFALGLFLFLTVGLRISVPSLLRWIGMVLILAILGKFRLVGDVLGLASLAVLVYLVGPAYLFVFGRMLLILYAVKVLFSAVKVLRTEVLVEKKRVEELREWDVLGEAIIETSEGIVRDREDFFSKLKKAIADPRVLKGPEGRIIASPTVEGLTREQIEELKRLVAEGRLENEFLVRKAMPFAPALFLGFLISAFFGDVLWWLMLKVVGA